MSMYFFSKLLNTQVFSYKKTVLIYKKIGDSRTPFLHQIKKSFKIIYRSKFHEICFKLFEGLKYLFVYSKWVNLRVSFEIINTKNVDVLRKYIRRSIFGSNFRRISLNNVDIFIKNAQK